jgi:hypothetical protein
MEKRQTHLEMIQGIINRLSHNSFLLKGWSVVLVSGMFTLAGYDSKIFFALLAYFPAVVFWGLDGFFLRQERLFRELYDQVRELPEEDIDYSMDTSKVQNRVESWLSVTFSKTLIPFHGVIFATVTIVILCSPYY